MKRPDRRKKRVFALLVATGALAAVLFCAELAVRWYWLGEAASLLLREASDRSSAVAEVKVVTHTAAASPTATS